MSQILKLRRSAVPGNVPSTSSIQLGEIAMNTYDGKLFMRKSSSIFDTVIEIGASSSYAATASYASNFTVAGTLTAQTLVVQTITSSTDYVTGSTRFGSLLSNTHQFTGSVSITGSLAINGSSVITSAQTSSLSVTSASYATTALSASYFSGSIANAVTAQTASYVTSSNVYGPYGANSILSSSYALTASYVSGSSSTSVTSSYALTASYVVTALTASYFITSSVTSASYASTASYVVNALTASYLQNPTNRIADGFATASVNGTSDPTKLFLVTSGSFSLFNIKSTTETNLYSNIFIINNFTTQQPVLTVSQSIVQFATQSSDPTGTAKEGSVWFTSSSLYIALS